MDSSRRFTRACFVSIPKCGKDVIHSFFRALRLKRWERDCGAVALLTQAWDLERLSRAGERLPPGLAQKDTAAVRQRLEPAMESFVEELSAMPEGTWLHGHFAYHPRLHEALRGNGIPIVFLHRDPRECLVSMANFLISRGQPADWAARLRSRRIEDVLRFLVAGDDDRLPFAQVFDAYRGWLGAEGVLSIRFRDIIGPRGRASEYDQVRWLTAVAEHVNWRGPAHLLASAILRTFNPRAGTFHRGRVGIWRDAVADPGVWTEIEDRLGGLVASWGYGPDPDGEASPEDALDRFLSRLVREHREAVGALEQRVAELSRETEERLRHSRALEGRLTAVEEDSAERLRLLRKREVALRDLGARLEAGRLEAEGLRALLKEAEPKPMPARPSLAQRLRRGLGWSQGPPTRYGPTAGSGGRGT